MKVIRIIEATEESKSLGFYEGEDYQIYCIMGNCCVNSERHENIRFDTLLYTGCIIKMIEL